MCGEGPARPSNAVATGCPAGHLGRFTGDPRDRAGREQPDHVPVAMCSVWLATADVTLGFTTDARFIRPRLAAVVGAIAALDPHATVQEW